MKKSLKVAVVFALIFAVGLATSLVYAEGYHKSKCRQVKLEEKISKKAHMMLMNQDELGLSDEQVKKIKDLKLKAKKDTIKQDAEIDVVALDIKAKMWEDALDVKAINKLIDKKYELKKAKAKSLIATYTSLKDTLNEGQKEKLKNLFKKCMTEKEMKCKMVK